VTQIINRKIGIKEGMQILIKNAPQEFYGLVDLEDTLIKKRITREALDYIHVFVRSEQELEQVYFKLKKGLKKNGMLWVSWPKGSSSIPTDLKRDLIRNYILVRGLVDVKVASVNDDWSALKFVYRLKDR